VTPCFCFSSRRSTFSLSSHSTGCGRLKRRTFSDTWKLVCVCVCIRKAESLWLRERVLPLTSRRNMSRRMGDKGVSGRGLSAKMNISTTGHKQAGNGSVVHVPAVIHNDNFYRDGSAWLFISEIMHLSKPKEYIWVSKAIPRLCQKRYSGLFFIASQLNEMLTCGHEDKEYYTRMFSFVRSPWVLDNPRKCFLFSSTHFQRQRPKETSQTCLLTGLPIWLEVSDNSSSVLMVQFFSSSCFLWVDTKSATFMPMIHDNYPHKMYYV